MDLMTSKTLTLHSHQSSNHLIWTYRSTLKTLKQVNMFTCKLFTLQLILKTWSIGTLGTLIHSRENSSK